MFYIDYVMLFLSWTYSESYQTSKMDSFAIIVYDFLLLTIFAKELHLKYLAGFWIRLCLLRVSRAGCCNFPPWGSFWKNSRMSVSVSFLLTWSYMLLIKDTLRKFEVIPAVNCMFKVNNRNTRTRCEICSKLTIKTPERPFWCLYC